MKQEDTNQDCGLIKEVLPEEVVVEVKRKGSCQNCSVNMLCMGGADKTQFRLRKPDIELSVGDEVILEISPSDRLFSSFIIFVFPIIMMVGFYSITRFLLKGSENAAIAGSLLGLLVSGIFIKYVDKLYSQKVMVKITGKLK